MMRIKTMAIALTGCAAMASGSLLAATLRIGRSSVVVTAGQTVEIPLFSNAPIAGDLKAHGAFEPGDVTFVDGPGCHLSANNCTLRITASPNSRNYIAVPVVVSESAATNTPVFALSVIRPGESAPSDEILPKIAPTPLKLSSNLGSTIKVQVANSTSQPLTRLSAVDLPAGVNASVCPKLKPGTTCSLKLTVQDTTQSGYFVISIRSDQTELEKRILSVVAPAVPPSVATSAVNPVEEPIQRSGNALFYGVAERHPSPGATEKTISHYTADTNGPSYQIVELKNRDVDQSLSVSLTGSGADHFTLDETAAHYGASKNCASLNRIAQGDSCLVIVKGKVGDPSHAPQIATLTLKGENNNSASFELRDTTYVYVAGGFNALGNASVSGGLLAQCTAGTCSNALQGTTGNNYASTNFSVGQWINALSVTSTGTLLVGGVFGAIGGATTGASSGTAALLAQCTPGPITGNACINQINTGATTSPYAFSNAYINAVTNPVSNLIYLGGDFVSLRTTTVAGKLLAKCSYSGSSANQSCSNYLTGASTKYASNTVSALDYVNSKLVVGGMFTQVAAYPSSAPSSGTTFATCTTSACSQGMADNPNNSILGVANDGTNIYLGGVFTAIGGYTDSSGGYPLVTCSLGTPTTCSNALSGSNNADGYIQGILYSGSNLYVGGKFTTIGGATPVSGGNMLAVCTPGGTCSNFVSDASPKASGDDWGGMISAITIGDQVRITAK